MESAIMDLCLALTLISTALLCALIYVYYKNLKVARSKFTIGLFVFAVLFLIQNLISLYYFITMMEYYAPEVEMHVFGLTLLQAIAFAILLKITWE